VVISVGTKQRDLVLKSEFLSPDTWESSLPSPFDFRGVSNIKRKLLAKMYQLIILAQTVHIYKWFTNRKQCHLFLLLRHLLKPQGMSRRRHACSTTPVSCLCFTEVYWAMSPNKSVLSMLPEHLPWVCFAPISSSSIVYTQVLKIQTPITYQSIVHI
jgi:hypothetical protein